MKIVASRLGKALVKTGCDDLQTQSQQSLLECCSDFRCKQKYAFTFSAEVSHPSLYAILFPQNHDALVETRAGCDTDILHSRAYLDLPR